MQFDRVRRDARLAVLKVEERDARDDCTTRCRCPPRTSRPRVSRGWSGGGNRGRTEPLSTLPP